MKSTLSKTSLALLLFATSAALGSTVPPLDITVKQKPAGKVVFQGRTDAGGNFVTGLLQPGTYNLEFRSAKTTDLKGKQLSISISAAKNQPRRSSASGEHLRGGVALEMELQSASKLKVQVQGAVQQAVSAKVPAGMEAVRANVKVMNGKRYIWVPGGIESRMGGKWVEEGTEGARLSTSNKKGEDREVLQSIQDQAGNVGQR